MTVNEIRLLLAKRCQEAGGQAEWGRQNGFDRRYVNDIISGRRAPGPRIMAALRLRKVTQYEIADAAP